MIGAVADLSGDSISGTFERTRDTLRLNAAGTYSLASTVSNIDEVTFGVNAAGFSLTVTDAQASTADADIDVKRRVGSADRGLGVLTGNAVMIDASALTGGNRIAVWDQPCRQRHHHRRRRRRLDQRRAGRRTSPAGRVVTSSFWAARWPWPATSLMAAPATTTLRLDAAGTGVLRATATISNIDRVRFNQNAAGFNLTVDRRAGVNRRSDQGRHVLGDLQFVGPDR